MQADRLQHVISEKVAQKRQSDVLVAVVDATQRRRLALVVDQVSEVVQEAATTSSSDAPSCCAS